MNFTLVRKIVTEIINSIQNTGIAVVKSLSKTITSHTYPVEVKNPVKEVTVKGKVVVENQSKVENELQNLRKYLVSIEKILPSLKQVTVVNPTKIPDFPKKIEVTNFPKPSDRVMVTNFSNIVDSLLSVENEVKKLKLSPQITIKAPIIPAPIVNIPEQPAPIVTINEKEVDLSKLTELVDLVESLTKNAKKSLSVRLSDGKEFYRAIDRVAEVVANKSSAFARSDGTDARAVLDSFGRLPVVMSKTFELNNSDVDGDTTYVGEETSSGVWKITKVVKTGDDTELSYATIRNNTLVDNYSNAWSDRAILTYGRVSEAL